MGLGLVLGGLGASGFVWCNLVVGCVGASSFGGLVSSLLIVFGCWYIWLNLLVRIELVGVGCRCGWLKWVDWFLGCLDLVGSVVWLHG